MPSSYNLLWCIKLILDEVESFPAILLSLIYAYQKTEEKPETETVRTETVRKTTLAGDEDGSGWLSPPCLILRDQAGSTCSRAG